MSIQPASLFTPRWEIFWGTTYSFELEFFDEYLLRRLGDLPLNATVLVDFASLARAWDAIQPGEEWRVQRVNRLYLVRAAGRPQGRFHPKTYFFANSKEGVLLVGSGNLSLAGLEEGKEVFSRFDSSDAEGWTAILAWRDWMNEIVQETTDQLLGQRWFRLRQTTREWLRGRSAASSFVTNNETSFLEQLLPVETRVDELHVTAPFFDRNAAALASLISRSKPEKIFVYLGRGARVDGEALAGLLGNAEATVSVFVFDPPRFVHAKLVALIQGETARLLSGSPNVSRAALTSTLLDDAWANTEAAVIVELPAQAARELFQPPDLEPAQISLNALADFSFEEAEEPISVPLRLLFAQPDEERRIVVSYVGDPPSDLYLSSASATVQLDGSRTDKAFTGREDSLLVWLSDQGGKRLSNRVPLDDPATLRNQLDNPTSRSTDRPRELDPADLEDPVAQVLARLHNQFIFDLDELESIREAERAEGQEGAEEEPGDFWERLAREELHQDPRAGGYRRFAGRTPFEDDDVLLLLRMMLDRAPEQRHPRIGAQPTHDGALGPGKGRAWTPTRRLQVRMMNVLTRWGRALADPRMNWIQPFASVRNFQALLYAAAELWELRALSPPKLKLATGLILGSFVRSEHADGYLFQIDGVEREQAIARLGPEARAVATSLAYLGLHPLATWEENIFEWQAWLRPCLEEGIVVATNEAAHLVSRIAGEQVTAEEIHDRLYWARDYIDDARWCLKMEQLCGLREVRFSREKFAFELVLEVEAERKLVDEPGVVRLMRNALDFRRADGIVIMSGRERVAVRLGELGTARLRNLEVLDTRQPVTEAMLALLEERGLSLREQLSAHDEETAVS